VKRFLAPALGALVAAGVLSIAPAQASAPDGEQTQAAILFGDDGNDSEATRTVLSTSALSGNYSSYTDGSRPAGSIEGQMPVDPAWFKSGTQIEFDTPGCCGTTDRGKVVLRYGQGWVTSIDQDTYEEYGWLNSALGRDRFISTSGGDLSVFAERCPDPWQDNQDGTFTCPSPGGPDETQIVASTSPSPSPGDNGDGASASGGGSGEYIQQFAKSSSMTCDEAQPEGLNWSGAPSGGWGESWAQWPNDGRGGEVCVRTLFYNTSTGKWDVR